MSSIASKTAPMKVYNPYGSTLETVGAVYSNKMNSVDTWATSGRIALNYQNAAENSLGSAISGLQGLVGNVEAAGTGENAYDINKNATFTDYKGQLNESKNALQGVQDNAAGISADFTKTVNDASFKYDNIIGNLNGINDGMGMVVNDVNGLRGNFQPVYNRLNNIKDDLGSIANDINRFVPEYAGRLNGMGNSLWDSGTSLLDMGGLFNTQAKQLMAMDGSGGGLIGAYVDSLNSIDPNKYVSMAAADVQRQFQNAQAQQNRQLARSGVDAGSARSVALQQQYAQAMAAASAGAKFRARLQGQNERLAAVNQAVNTANALAQTGTQISTAGAGVQAQGAGIIGNAANLEMGGAQAKVGVEQAQVGVQNAWLNALNGELQNYNASLNGLNAQAAIQQQIAANETQKITNASAAAKMGLDSQNVIMNAENSKADAQYKAASLEADVNMKAWQSTLGYQVDAAKALASAQMEAGKFYQQEASDWGKIAGSGGLMNALGY